MIRRILVLLMLCSALMTANAQKYNISGQVLNSTTSLPIEDVNITIVGKPIGTTTNKEGNFTIDVSRLPCHIYFSHIGYSIDQILVTEVSSRIVEILLEPETTKLKEVVVSTERIKKVQLGDTLNVMDYSIIGDRILLVASPYRNQLDERLYLTDLSGTQIDNLPLKHMGRSIKIPEDIAPKYIFLYEDFMGNSHILTRTSLLQIEVSGDTISLGRKTTYPDFLKYLLPNKLLLGSSLFYQESSRKLNITKRIGPDARRPQLVKTVYDSRGVAKGPYDPSRYTELEPRDQLKSMYKNVSSPIIGYNHEAYIFDFFKNHIEVFDSLGKFRRVIPIGFHLETYQFFLNLFSATDLNQKEFRQKVLVDPQTKKVYALFNQIGKRAILKEINMENGKIVKEIEIPDLPNVYQFSVSNSTVYFMYHVMIYPFYTNLYRLKI